MDKKTPIIKYTPTYRKIGSFVGKSTGLNNPAFTTTIPSFKRRVSTLQRDHDPLRDAAPEAAEKALKFISSGKKLGSSVISGARNNVSTLNKVVPSVPKVYNETLIENISQSNIGAPTKSPENLEQNQTKKKPKDFNLNFISEFVNFFGSKKTEKRIRKSLTVLRDSLVNTFEIAKLLRVAIKKIAKQLSKLRLRGGGGGGLGSLLGGLLSAGGGLLAGAGGLLGGAGALLGRNRQRNPRTPRLQNPNQRIPRMGSRFGRGKLAALLGLGSVAGLAAPSIFGSEDQQGVSQLTTDDAVINKFNNVLDRFEDAIDSLLRTRTKEKKKQGRSSAGGMSLGSIGRSGSSSGSAGGPSFSGSAPVQEIEKDTEFIDEVKKLAAETGAKPSELMALYQAESGLDPTRINQSNKAATGLFQLMFRPGESRYGKTQSEFAAMSRADQVRAHREYLKETGFFSGTNRGISAVKVANIAPAFLGESPETPMYRKGSKAYEDNKAVDEVYGNNDGVIDANDYAAFVKAVGNPSQFAQFDTGSATPTVTPASRTESSQRSLSPPGPTKGKQSVNIIPFQSGGQQNVQPAQQSQKPMNLSGSSNNGPTIDFLPSKNFDSYNGLYAKMVYNIVDG